MWLPGHLAVGLLICLPAIVLYSRRQGSLVIVLAFIALFANLLDFLHFGDLRPFSHSLFGASLMLCFSLLMLYLLLGWRPLLFSIATLAVASHLLADLFIGHIYPWYPWSMTIVQLNQFNTLFDIRVELVLSLLALFAIAAIVVGRPNKIGMDKYGKRELAAIGALFTIFFGFASAQMLYFIYQDIFHSPTISEFLLSFVFVGAISCSLAFLLLSVSTYNNRKNIP